MDILSRISAARGKASPKVVGFHEPDTGSCQYICIDEATGKAALINLRGERLPPVEDDKHSSLKIPLDRF